MSKIINSAWLPHPVPAGCRRAGRQGEGRGPRGELGDGRPPPPNPTFTQTPPHREKTQCFCPRWPWGPHSDAASLFVGPGVQLVEHEAFPIIREHTEKQDGVLPKNQSVLERRGHRADVLEAQVGQAARQSFPEGTQQ